SSVMPCLATRMATVFTVDMVISAPHVLAEKRPNQLRDGVALGLECEMAGIEQVIFEYLHIALVGLGAGGRKDLVVLAPDDQHRWLILAEVGLPLWIERRVASIAEEEVELNLVIALAVEQVLVFRCPVRPHQLWILCTRRVLPACCLV